jgi:hypothetical protein
MKGRLKDWYDETSQRFACIFRRWTTKKIDMGCMDVCVDTFEHHFPSRPDLREAWYIICASIAYALVSSVFSFFLFWRADTIFVSWPASCPFLPSHQLHTPVSASTSTVSKYFGKLNASPSPTRIIPDPDSHEANPGPKGSRSTVVCKFNSNCGKQLGG